MLGLALHEFEVGDAGGVELCVFDRRPRLLDSDDATSAICGGNGEDADARVGVHDRLLTRKPQAFADQRQHPFRLPGVHLEEGRRADPEPVSLQFLFVVRLAGEHPDIPALEMGLN